MGGTLVPGGPADMATGGTVYLSGRAQGSGARRRGRAHPGGTEETPGSSAVPLPTAPGCCTRRGSGVRRKRKERGGSFAQGSLRTCATQKQGFWNHCPERESWCCPTTHQLSRLPSPSLCCPVWDRREGGNQPRRGITARMHANTRPTSGTRSAFNVAL